VLSKHHRVLQIWLGFGWVSISFSTWYRSSCTQRSIIK